MPDFIQLKLRLDNAVAGYPAGTMIAIHDQLLTGRFTIGFDETNLYSVFQNPAQAQLGAATWGYLHSRVGNATAGFACNGVTFFARVGLNV